MSLHANRHHRGRFVALFLAPLVGILACADTRATGDSRIQGAYRLDDGRLISIRQSTKKNLRYREYATGKSGRLFRQSRLSYVAGPGFADRSPVKLEVDFSVDDAGGGASLTWRRRDDPPLGGKRIGVAEPVTFHSSDVTLSGRLDLPEGAGPHPAIVLVHGSGMDAATDFYFNGDFLSAHGIATLTFDKRGTGGSGGEQTFDFQVLARDVVAAVRHLGQRPDIDPEQIGLSGYSQGGWVAPLAASLSPDIRFVLVHYALIASPAEEARVETRNTLRERGAGKDELEQLDRLTLAGVRIIANDFRDGWDEFGELERAYKREPWMKLLGGTVVGKMVKYPRWLTRWIGPRYAPPGLDWYYESEPVLAKLSIPMVWFVGEADSSAPPELTLPALERLRAAGKPFEVIRYPGAEHTMLLFRDESGERVYTGYAPGYFMAEVEAARRLAGLSPGATQ